MCSRLNDKPPARSSVWLGVHLLRRASLCANHATPSDLALLCPPFFCPPLTRRPEPAPGDPLSIAMNPEHCTRPASIVLGWLSCRSQGHSDG